MPPTQPQCRRASPSLHRRNRTPPTVTVFGGRQVVMTSSCRHDVLMLACLAMALVWVQHQLMLSASIDADAELSPATAVRGEVLMGQTGARDHRIDGDRSRHAPRAARALVCRQSAEMMPRTGGERNATDMRRDRPPCQRCVMGLYWDRCQAHFGHISC